MTLSSVVSSVYQLHLVKAAEGQQSVLLPCKTRTHLHPNATVEWRRVDRDVVVHMYPNHQELPARQDETYQNRTEMMENALKTGDLSLTLSRPFRTDSGLYVCTVLKDGHKVKQKVVSLYVKGKCFEHIPTGIGSVLIKHLFMWSFSNWAFIFQHLSGSTTSCSTIQNRVDQ